MNVNKNMARGRVVHPGAASPAPQTQVAIAIDPISTNSGAKVSIAGLNVSQGDGFANAGFPLQVTPACWIGQAMNAGRQTYEIEVKVTVGALRPIDDYINWDPFIVAC